MRRPLTVYRCLITGTLWPRSICGLSPEAKGESQLEPVTHAELDGDPRFGRMRTELMTAPVFQIGIWADEHSAQLEPDESRRIQELFAGGARNILSATTTMEVGIDIGGLSAVMMGNVPPDAPIISNVVGEPAAEPMVPRWLRPTLGDQHSIKLCFRISVASSTRA